MENCSCVNNNLLTIKNSEAERLELMHSLREKGKTLQEIADIVGSSTSTVHRLIQKKS